MCIHKEPFHYSFKNCQNGKVICRLAKERSANTMKLVADQCGIWYIIESKFENEVEIKFVIKITITKWKMMILKITSFVLITDFCLFNLNSTPCFIFEVLKSTNFKIQQLCSATSKQKTLQYSLNNSRVFITNIYFVCH